MHACVRVHAREGCVSLLVRSVDGVRYRLNDECLSGTLRAAGGAVRDAASLCGGVLPHGVRRVTRQYVTAESGAWHCCGFLSEVPAALWS